MSEQSGPETSPSRISMARAQVARARAQVDQATFALRVIALDVVHELVLAAHPTAHDIVLEPSDQADHYLGGDIRDSEGNVLGAYDDLDPASDVLSELGYGGGVPTILRQSGVLVLLLTLDVTDP